VVVSLILSIFSTSYAFITSITLLLVVVFVHGLFWSALLSASSAYMTATSPADRRAQGLGYWGLMSVTAIAVAPTLGFVMYHHGWRTLCFELAALNLTMAIIATRLPDDAVSAEGPQARKPGPGDPGLHRAVEWNILALSVCLGLVAFGYGGLTSFSALFADAEHISPRSAYLSVMAVTILVSRLGFGHRMDRIGHRRVLLPCLALTSVGLGLLAATQGIVGFTISAMAFGAGFGLMYPAFAAYVMEHVDARRRGAAFGAIISAFDTGIGMGSTSIGWIVRHSSYRTAFAVAAGLAALSLPYFVITEKRLGFHDVRKGRA
jgi:MFS family permease